MNALDEDDDLLAAEFVLGTLDSAERAVARARVASDITFDRAVQAWNDRLSPLTDAVESIEPPAGLLMAILNKVEGTPHERSNEPSADVIVLRRKLRVWRTVASMAGGLAAALAIWVSYSTYVDRTSSQTYVAVLQQGADKASFVVSLDLADRRMTVVPLATARQTGKSYELWMIGNDKSPPRSLGVLLPDAANHPILPPADPALISNATYAVTLEAQGGSATGQPTSAPIFAGHLLDVSR